MSKVHKLLEELLLVVLIAMNVMELFDLLPGIAGFFKAIMSMTTLSYVFYKASLSDIFFGEKNISLDLILILSYLLMIINKFVQYFLISIEEIEVMQYFFSMVVDNSVMIEKISFIVGSLFLVMISFFVTKYVEFKEPSVLSILHGEGFRNVKKFFSVLIVVSGFFIIFFNPIMEWFTLVIDTPLVVLVLFFYIFKVHDIGKKMDEEQILFKISDAAEEFIDSFIKLFHDKKTIFFGISALLVLHPLVDAYVFIVPYSFDTKTIYNELGQNHQPLKEYFAIEKESMSYAEQLMLYFGYLFNVIAILFLMFMPAYLWYKIHQGRDINYKIDFNGIAIAFMLFCLAFFILMPSFTIGNSELKNLLGVDIQTRGIYSENFSTYFYICCAVFIVALLLSFIDKIKSLMVYLISMFSLGFFGLYIYSYFTSIITFYIEFVEGLWNYDIVSLYLMSYYILFMIVLSLFYVGGFIGYVLEVFEIN